MVIAAFSAPTDRCHAHPDKPPRQEVIRRVVTDLDAPIIDVGGGASTLVDGLLDAGY